MQTKLLCKALVAALLLLLNCALHAQDWRWAKAAGGNGDDLAAAIAVDASQNTYVTGYFVNNATFGSTNLTNAGSRDIFIAKYNATGQVVWAQRAGGNGLDEVIFLSLRYVLTIIINRVPVKVSSKKWSISYQHGSFIRNH
ncbi:MAG: hypothetical protein MUF24_12630 [Chitinophagaceae bacterium]|nr:hypothetical protein [Chitinophagaceae bacterium]